MFYVPSTYTRFKALKDELLSKLWILYCHHQWQENQDSQGPLDSRCHDFHHLQGKLLQTSQHFILKIQFFCCCIASFAQKGQADMSEESIFMRIVFHIRYLRKIMPWDSFCANSCSRIPGYWQWDTEIPILWTGASFSKFRWGLSFTFSRFNKLITTKMIFKKSNLFRRLLIMIPRLPWERPSTLFWETLT